MVLAQTALAYSHAAGVFFAAITVAATYGLDPRRPHLPKWLRLQGLSLIFLLPSLAYPLLKQPPHLHAPNINDVVETFALFVVGPHSGRIFNIIGAVAFLVSICALIADRRYGRPALILFVLPFLSGGLLSYLIKPVWQSERLFAFLLPYYCMGLAYLVAGVVKGGVSNRVRGLIGGGVLILAMISSVFLVTGFQKQGRFIDAAEYLRRNAEPGDQVILPNERHAWAFNWYFLGPGWDRDLAVSPVSLLRPQQWPMLIDEIRAYDFRTRHISIDVVSDLTFLDRASSRHLWLLARSPEVSYGAFGQNRSGRRDDCVARAGYHSVIYSSKFLVDATPRP